MSHYPKMTRLLPDALFLSLPQRGLHPMGWDRKVEAVKFSLNVFFFLFLLSKQNLVTDSGLVHWSDRLKVSGHQKWDHITPSILDLWKVFG